MKKDKVAFITIPGCSREIMDEFVVVLRTALRDTDFEIILTDRKIDLISKEELFQAIENLKK